MRRLLLCLVLLPLACSETKATSDGGALSAGPRPSGTAPPTATSSAVAKAADEWSEADAKHAAQLLASLEHRHGSGMDLDAVPVGAVDDASAGMNGWKLQQVVEVQFAVSPKLAKQRACVLPGAIDGLRCAYESAAKPMPDAPSHTSKELLQWYETVTGIRFLGAGLWTLPVPKARLASRDEVPIVLACKLRVAGRAIVGHRLRDNQPWKGSPGPFDVGRFESCALSPPRALDAGAALAGDASVPSGSVLIGASNVLGGTLAGASRVVAGLRGKFRDCYQQGLNSHPELRGSASLSLKVAPDGSVPKVGTGFSGPLLPIMPCLKAAGRTAKFAASPAGAIVSVSLVFKHD